MTDALYLLDSNICIYLLAGLSPPARAHVEAHRPGEVVTSAIVCAEILHGIDPDDRPTRAKVEALFRIVPVLPFDDAAARAYAGVPFRRRGFDRLIGAHALSLNLTIVTNNEEDFADMGGLRIENWTV